MDFFIVHERPGANCIDDFAGILEFFCCVAKEMEEKLKCLLLLFLFDT